MSVVGAVLSKGWGRRKFLSQLESPGRRNRAVRESIKDEARQEALHQVRVSAAEAIAPRVTELRCELFNLLGREARIAKTGEYFGTLGRSRPLKVEYLGGTSAHGGIYRVEAIRTQHDERGKSVGRQSVEATDQGVDSGAILMVHLSKPA